MENNSNRVYTYWFFVVAVGIIVGVLLNYVSTITSSSDRNPSLSQEITPPENPVPTEESNTNPPSSQ